MRALAAFVILGSMSLAHAGAPADKKLVTKTQLLGDHLSATLPADMRIVPRRASIMAAENSGEDETRGMLDDGKARFVMMAYETYSLAGSDVKAAVEADFKRGGYTGKLDALALPKPLVGFGHAPATIGKTEEANLAYAAWIASGDGSVQFVAFYVNPDGAAQGASWSALGKKITATLAPGKRTLAPKAGDKTLDDLIVTIPDAWTVSAQPGPDFTVFHLRKLAVLGTDAPTCGVYIGGHPSRQHSQQDSKAKTATTSGKLFGTKVDWTTWAEGGRSSTEALAKHPNGRDMVHVFCSAPTEPELADLRKLAETLRKK